METQANLSIELNVNCPHCDNYFDLFDIEELNDEGELINAACPDGHWSDEHQKFKLDVKCPECGETINVRTIYW